ncbi:glycerophosphodiester phosphodiesterase [bacterium]|nr:glycerophosphodiester phosphodiesterase [bacterium]
MNELYTLFLFTAVIMLLNGCGSTPAIIAHRGASYRAPENTLAAVKLAWELGADAVEVDVHMTKDGKIAVIHDATTKRITGVDLMVNETSSEALRELDAGSFKSPEYAGERIPFLDEVIGTIPDGKRLFIEIKSGPDILPALREVIDNSGKRLSIVIIGFDLDTVSRCKVLMPEIPVHWLAVSKKNESSGTYRPYDAGLIDIIKKHNLDGLDVHYGGVTKEFAGAVRSADLALYAWTVDDPSVARKLRQYGVNGITTNRPAWLKEQMR